MSAALTVRPGERGVVRVFALDMAPEQARFLREDGAAAQKLGVDHLDMDQVEIFPLSDLDELGLAGYLVAGCGVDEDDLAADRSQLETLEGWVMLVRSRAFGADGATLSPEAELRLVGTWSEPGVTWSAEPLTAESARPHSAAPSRSPRAVRAASRRTGAAVFVVVMILVLLGLWWSLA